MKNAFAVILAIILAISLSACGQKKEVYRKPVDTLPDMDMFSDAQYRSGAAIFPPIASAVLISGEERKELSPDDPQLKALMNCLAYSTENDLDGMTYTAYFEEDIQRFCATDSRRMEIEFDNSENPNKQRQEVGLILCEGWYLLRIEHSENGSYAYQLWPYAALAQRENIPWGSYGEMWLDVLTYAGF